ncbi:MAG: ATPase, T2SS/T4P/T4SS family [Myxococcota bacterium]
MNASFQIAFARTGEPWEHLELPPTSSITVGRDASCDVVLLSPEVSRKHLEVHQSERGLEVVDCSVNGTGLGQQSLRHCRSLISDDSELRIGPFSLRVRIRSASDPGHSEKGSGSASPDLRRRIHGLLLDRLDLRSLDRSQMGQDRLRPRVLAALRQVLGAMDQAVLDRINRAELEQQVLDEVLGLGPLQSLLDDDQVSEIMVVDPETIYVERMGAIERTPLRFADDESCRSAIERVVTPLGRRIDESAPLVDARLPDGSRVNAIIPPLAVRGPCITIRKFPKHALTMTDLLANESLTPRMARFLERCVIAKKNILISGGTGSGKTTLLNVLSGAIPARERIITIEDAAELKLQQPHVVSLEAKPPNLEGSGAYSIRQLVKNALRMRPDRIVVGECRAGEAIDMLQAMNTGHAGSMTTTHANSPREALARIQTLCMMADLELPPLAVKEQVAESIDIIVQPARFSDGARRVTAITEVEGLDARGEILLRDIFEFRQAGTGESGEVLGEYAPTGYLPSFLSEFMVRGLVAQGEYL